MQATHFDRQEDRQRIEELDIVKALGIIRMWFRDIDGKIAEMKK